MSNSNPPPPQQSLIARYNDADWVRYAVQRIPVLGSAVDLALTTGHRRIVQQRTRMLLAGLEADVERIDAEKIDRGFLQSDEFHDLVIEAIRNSIATGHRERIRINSRILAGAFRTDRPPESRPDVCLELIRDLSPDDLAVLRAIGDQQRQSPTDQERNPLIWASSRGWDSLVTSTRSAVLDFDYSLHKLERAACIKEITGTYFNYTGGTYLLTDAARRLLDWLDLCGGFPTDADIKHAQASEAAAEEPTG